MYLAKILCAGILLFILSVAVNIATFFTVIRHSYAESEKRIPATNIAESLE